MKSVLKEYTRLDGDQRTKLEEEVAKEVALAIFVNGRHFSTAMMSPQMKKEFVLGHLLSEGVIEDIEDVESMKIREDMAKVITKNPTKVFAAKKVIVSGCGGASGFLDESKLPKVGSQLKLDRKVLFECIKKILTSELHQRTGGTHTCAILEVSKTELCFVSEDIGRHNALDKIIGYALLKKYHFPDTFVVCTGRISSEMVLKCSVAKIPIIASRGAVTSLAVEIANKTGLTVIGFVRGKRMNIYSNEQRIL
ncbi:MAG: formate dehydrogenase accessory sulfurtransferase FdhD [Methanocellales archaeon]|nr:formate dehydrogenase accessory sulfurtransferase FdhD [Methanocellales archaeon]MDD3291901.1 formate dehydrogenase accessory sulfurtransferase FdhD [Methanocellales archaeon]MDD5235788.1 formate dehydrogenase accessory sulfurtransferase FdhD [Methanocellales archaeon]MDD5485545.1 formate dehydrogenase accessory sulfurtransferase FdhD [Methanocellales archaeon]